MDWNGFTAIEPASHFIEAPNGPGALVIEAPNQEGSSFSFRSGVGILHSFYFGCSGYFKGLGGPIPEACTIQIVALENFGSFSIGSYGPFTSSVNYTSLQDQVPAQMTQVTIDSAASTYYIYVTGGSAYSTLFLANLYYDTNC